MVVCLLFILQVLWHQKLKRSQIEAFRRQFLDEPTDEEHLGNEQTLLRRSIEDYSTQPDPAAPQPQTRAAARAGQTQARGDSPS